jgi:hypothetical protein
MYHFVLLKSTISPCVVSQIWRWYRNLLLLALIMKLDFQCKWLEIELSGHSPIYKFAESSIPQIYFSAENSSIVRTERKAWNNGSIIVCFNILCLLCKEESLTEHQVVNKIKNLWRWYISAITEFLDINHRPAFIKITAFRRLDSVSIFR